MKVVMESVTQGVIVFEYFFIAGLFSTPGPFGYFARVPGVVTSTDTEYYRPGWQVYLGCYFLQRSPYYRRFCSSLRVALSEQ
jgi:hypothetical protein